MVEGITLVQFRKITEKLDDNTILKIGYEIRCDIYDYIDGDFFKELATSVWLVNKDLVIADANIVDDTEKIERL